jgi:hypothetical protein
LGLERYILPIDGDLGEEQIELSLIYEKTQASSNTDGEQSSDCFSTTLLLVRVLGSQ